MAWRATRWPFTSKDCPKPIRLFGSSGATEPIEFQFVVSCLDIEETKVAFATEKKRDMLFASWG